MNITTWNSIHTWQELTQVQLCKPLYRAQIEHKLKRMADDGFQQLGGGMGSTSEAMRHATNNVTLEMIDSIDLDSIDWDTFQN